MLYCFVSYDCIGFDCFYFVIFDGYVLLLFVLVFCEVDGEEDVWLYNEENNDGVESIVFCEEDDIGNEDVEYYWEYLEVEFFKEGI